MTLLSQRVIGFAIVGMLVAALAAPFSSTVAIVALCVGVGPFLCFGCLFVLAFGLGVALKGDPDIYVERLLR